MHALHRTLRHALLALTLTGCVVGQQKTETSQVNAIPYLKLTTPRHVMPDAQKWEGGQFPHTLSVLELKRDGVAVVVCTHNLRETARVADRLAVMAAGRILAAGSLAELQSQLGLKPRYVRTMVPGLEDIYMEVMARAGRLAAPASS